MHVTVVQRDGVGRLVELMRLYEDNVDIQLHSCRVLGNLAVNGMSRDTVYYMYCITSVEQYQAAT